MHSLTHNLITVRGSGCVIAENFIIKPTDYMKNAYAQFIMIRSSYEELLSKDGSVSMHHQNLQKLIIEFYKVVNGLCPEIMNEIFQFQTQNHHNLRNNSTFRIPSFNTIFQGKESVSYLGPKIWSQVPDEIKSLESVRSFKKAIKRWIQ